jgi:hypothetical protein
LAPIEKMSSTDPNELRAAISHLLEQTEEELRLPDAPHGSDSDGRRMRARALEVAAAELIDRHEDQGNHGDVATTDNGVARGYERITDNGVARGHEAITDAGVAAGISPLRIPG